MTPPQFGVVPTTGASADVLVVDDDDELASILELVLGDAGLHVRVARNGADALARLDERLPDLVVTDLDMPVLTGPEMMAQMLALDFGREDIPVVVVSASPDCARIAAGVGTPYVLPKPFSVEDLLAVVTRALRERTLPRPPAH